MGGMEQDAGGTMLYNLVLGSNDTVSEVTEVIVTVFHRIVHLKFCKGSFASDS